MRYREGEKGAGKRPGLSVSTDNCLEAMETYHAATPGERVLLGAICCFLALPRISSSAVKSRNALSCEIFKSQTSLSASEPLRIDTSESQGQLDKFGCPFLSKLTLRPAARAELWAGGSEAIQALEVLIQVAVCRSPVDFKLFPAVTAIPSGRGRVPAGD